MDSDELPDLGAKPRREILAICGGGYAGLFAAEFLRRLERRLGRPIGNVYDLISGTSVGGLLALGLAAKIPAEQLSDLLVQIGPALFGAPGFGIFAPKHDNRALVAAANALFGDRTLEGLDTDVLIPAVDVSAAETTLFGNGPGDPTRRWRVVDVALATSAAPFYLPPFPIDDRLFADGALVANSPEAIAAWDAIHRRRWAAERTTLLVVGSTQNQARVPGYLVGEQWGLGRWIWNNQLLATTMRAQMSLARQLSTIVLGREHVLVADVELTAQEAKAIGLDKPGPRATESLRSLAAQRYGGFEVDHEGYLQRLQIGRPT